VVVADDEATVPLGPADSDRSTVVRRRAADETHVDLTTPTTTQCVPTVDDDDAAPPLSRRASDVASRPPSSALHPVLPPIRQLRSVDTVVTVAADVAAGLS